jgi:2-dehydrotetronate isomerase
LWPDGLAGVAALADTRIRRAQGAGHREGPRGAKGIMQRFAANLAFMFAEHPMMARFGAAAAAGFKAVELQFPYDLAPTDVRAELQRHGLTQLGINTQPRPNGGESGLGAVPGREREFAEVFQKALDYVVAIGGTAIHTMAGVVPPEQRPAAERVFVANYTHAADLAAEKNITLLIEPLNPRDRPDYFVGRVEQAADLIAQIGRPNVKIQFDFYHVQIISGDLLTRFERFLPVIGHVQIAAVPSRAEPDEGEVNFAAVFDALDRLGYAGWIGCEYKPRGRTEDGLGWGKTYGLGS